MWPKKKRDSLIFFDFLYSIATTFKSLFWALFGLGDVNANNLAPFNSSLTETFGFILYGSYHVISIIILINMLIASMTLSYEHILVQYFLLSTFNCPKKNDQRKKLKFGACLII
jgi:hypothetical protein